MGYRLVDSTGSTVENTGPGLGSGVIINHICITSLHEDRDSGDVFHNNIMQCWKFTRDSRRFTIRRLLDLFIILIFQCSCLLCL